jgi:hypothetical protein
MTNPESVERADFTSASSARQSRFTFGGDKQRPGSDLPKLPLDGLNGYVMVQGQDGSSGRRKGLTPRDAQLSQQRATLLKESQNLQGSYRELLKEKEARQQQKDPMDAVRRTGVMKAKSNQVQPSAPPGPSQMRFFIESQDKNIEELKEVMTRFTHEFKHVGAKLRHIEGGVDQLATKTAEIESTMEAWTEEDALDPCAEEGEEDDGDWPGWNGKADQEDESAPDGAADGKETKKTRLDDQLDEGEQEDEEGLGDEIL